MPTQLYIKAGGMGIKEAKIYPDLYSAGQSKFIVYGFYLTPFSGYVTIKSLYLVRLLRISRTCSFEGVFSGCASPEWNNVQLEQELAGFTSDRDSLVAIGVFDGVHLGHKYLLSQLKELAGQQGLSSVVVTFDKHPQKILKPHSHPLFLTDTAEKAELLSKENVNAVIVLTFTLELSSLSAREFVTILRSKLKMRGLVMGPDFALGRQGEGNIPALRDLGKELGFSVTAIPAVHINGDTVSSTAIRHAMTTGDMEKVQRMMGRPFSLHGKVIHGHGRGVGLGFPTVNLDVLKGQALPGDGVYATLGHCRNSTYLSVTNVGTNPTFGGTRRTIESFFLDYHDDLYGCEVKIDFKHKLRGEIKFKDPSELTHQIEEDIRNARSFLEADNK
jgi:riboflavin kinase / FMN adenylyltransferase